MSSLRIERNGNGFEVNLCDPAIEAENRKKDSSYRDPYVEYNFDTWDQVKAFLDKVVEKALPADEFSSAFDAAAKEVTSGK